MTSRAPSTLMHAIRAALASTGRVMINRNNSGVDLTRGVRYGVGVGSGDFVGCCLPHGRYFELEVKSGTGRPSQEQLARARAVRSFGGYYGVAHSIQEALEHLDRASRGEP